MCHLWDWRHVNALRAEVVVNDVETVYKLEPTGDILRHFVYADVGQLMDTWLQELVERAVSVVRLARQSVWEIQLI